MRRAPSRSRSRTRSVGDRAVMALREECGGINGVHADTMVTGLANGRRVVQSVVLSRASKRSLALAWGYRWSLPHPAYAGWPYGRSHRAMARPEASALRAPGAKDSKHGAEASVKLRTPCNPSFVWAVKPRINKEQKPLVGAPK